MDFPSLCFLLALLDPGGLNKEVGTIPLARCKLYSPKVGSATETTKHSVFLPKKKGKWRESLGVLKKLCPTLSIQTNTSLGDEVKLCGCLSPRGFHRESKICPTQ